MFTKHTYKECRERDLLAKAIGSHRGLIDIRKNNRGVVV